MPSSVHGGFKSAKADAGRVITLSRYLYEKEGSNPSTISKITFNCHEEGQSVSIIFLLSRYDI